MALVAYVSAPPDLESEFSKQFTPVYKTKHSSLRWNGRIIPKRRVKEISARSLLPQIRDIWATLSPEVQEQWKLAGAESSINGWQQFVQDTAYRIKYGLEGIATPSVYHQYKCGQINIAAPATNFRLIQLHPRRYYQMVKLPGNTTQREPRPVDETLTLPLQVAASYKTDLTANGPNPYCKFYAEVDSHYQGTTRTIQVGFSTPLQTGWARQSQTCTNVVGVARWYRLYWELNDVSGTLEFDIIRAYHTGTNFARDFRCTNISAGYSDYNYQLPASWAAEAATAGVTYGSVYPE